MIYGISTNAAIIMVVLGLAYAMGVTILQRKITNPKRMREVQMKSKILQKEMNDLVKSKASQELILAKQKEMLPLINESMVSAIKPLIIIFPLFILIYDYGIPKLPFIASSPGGGQWVFFVSALVSGLVAGIVVYFIDKRAMKIQQQKDMANAVNVKISE
jgi:uncharacterized membrane protein (DUF106 family)